MKILVLVLIVAVCSIIGHLYGEDFKKRYLELSELLRCLIDMENEIKYAKVSLPEILKKIGEKSDTSLSSIFIKASETLFTGEVSSVLDGFRVSIDTYKRDISLQESDLDILLDLSKSLGETDINGQEHIFLLAKENLKRTIELAEKEYRTNYKMYKALGFGIGALIAIFLI